MKLRFRIGATMQFLLAIGHLLCMFDLWQMFEIYHIDQPMAQIASYWSLLPYLITIGLAVCFALAGLYALAYCGDIRPLPLTHIAVWVIFILFVSRGLMGFISLIQAFSLLKLSSALIALFIGLCYTPTKKIHS